jgi:DNA-binding NtrC family response regulator
MKIGILEDQVVVSDMLTYACKLDGHSVSAYTSATTFLPDVLAEYPTGRAFDALVVDLLLQGVSSGTEVIRCVKKFYPDLTVVLISATSLAEIEAAVQELPTITTLQKPFKIRSLLDLIEQGKHG